MLQIGIAAQSCFATNSRGGGGKFRKKQPRFSHFQSSSNFSESSPHTFPNYWRGKCRSLKKAIVVRFYPRNSSETAGKDRTFFPPTPLHAPPPRRFGITYALFPYTLKARSLCLKTTKIPAAAVSTDFLGATEQCKHLKRR